MGVVVTKQTYEALEGVAACVGIHSGILPFVFKLTGWHVSGLALPLLLPDPAALIVAGSVLVACFAALWRLDHVKKKGLVS